MIGINSYTYNDPGTGEPIGVDVAADAFADRLMQVIEEADAAHPQPDDLAGKSD